MPAYSFPYAGSGGKTMALIPNDTLEWQAEWIWLPEMRRKPNFYFYARKTFVLRDSCDQALLHISAYTDYMLYINGAFVSRGPSPSNGKVMTYDTHDIAKYLRVGNNVIAVLAHNYAVGVHWNPAGPGGLIVQAEIRTAKGTLNLATDETWKVKTAECFDACSPRMMFSCRYLETFHMDRYETGWNTVEYNDVAWRKPEIIGKTPVFPYERLIPKPIPFLREECLKPVSAEKGTCVVQGFHAVSFKDIEKPDSNCLYHATAFFHSDSAREAILLLSCDDAFIVFLNGQKILEQSYDEQFIRMSLFWGREEYEQFHNGISARKEQAKVQLIKGWNKLTVAVDQGEQGWGFAMGFHDGGSVDDRTDIRLLHLPFAATPEGDGSCWELKGPFESSGLKNSLERINCDTAPEGGQTGMCRPSILNITDYQLLMRAESRSGFSSINPREPVTLNEGDSLLVDLGIMQVGYATLDIELQGEAVLDVYVGNVLSEQKKPCGMGELRNVDRLYLLEGSLVWEAASRRDGRYIHICCRKGSIIRLNAISMTKVGYPVESQDSFECSDKQMNDIYEASKLSMALIMHHNYEDCLRREEGLHNGRNVIHAFMASYFAYGDGRLLKKMFQDLLQTQNDQGWISGSGPSDDTNDEISKAMWSLEYLLRYYQFTGDADFIRQVYEQVRCFMRYLSRLENKRILIDGKNEFNNARGRSIWIDDHVVLNDWPDQNLTLFSFNALYYGTLLNMAEISDAAGKLEDGLFYRKKAGYLKESFNKILWDETKSMYADWEKDGVKADEIQDAYLILALYYGICDEDKAQRVLDWLFDKSTGTLRNFEDYRFTFGYYYFVLTVLFKNGMNQFAYDLMRTYFGAWLDLGFTAFGEHFFLSEAKGKNTLGREINVHTDSTAAHVFFYSHLLGIKPLQPGFGKIAIAPVPGDVAWAKGSVYTPKGIVEVSWEMEGNRMHLDLVIPEGMEYEIATPDTMVIGNLKVQTRRAEK